MIRLRHLLKNISLVNVVLACVLAYLIHSVALPFFNVKVGYQPTAPKKAEVSAAAVKPKQPEVKGPSPMDYVIIADQNAFHPERRIPVPKVEAPPLPKPDFALYGTMQTDDFAMAYMEDRKAPKTTQGRGKRVTTVRQGESFSGFVLKDVDTEKVVMVRGDESIVVYLNDRTKAREGAAPPTGGAAAHPQRPAAANPQPQPAAVVAPVAQIAPEVPHPNADTLPAAPVAARPRRSSLFANPK